MRLLLVEDDAKLAHVIQRRLSEEAYTVDVATDGQDALGRLRRTTYDLIVLDLMLPSLDGFGVCREIRSSGLDIPILILSARGMVDDRVKALDTGADDYLTKPFAFDELSARIRAMLRRRQPALVPLTVADLKLDPVTGLVRRGERRIELTDREYALLEYLMRHAGHVVTRAMIAENVWHLTWRRLTNVIDVYVNHVRRKIEAPGEPRLIHAVRGTGYVIREPGGASL